MLLALTAFWIWLAIAPISREDWLLENLLLVTVPLEHHHFEIVRGANDDAEVMPPTQETIAALAQLCVRRETGLALRRAAAAMAGAHPRVRAHTGTHSARVVLRPAIRSSSDRLGACHG
jgi:hypothetical protein